MVFAQAHFGSTWFIYLDKKNREYFRQHYLIYYIFPLALFFGVIALGLYNLILLVILTSLFSFYHVTRQNVGILQLYRMRNKEFSKIEKHIEEIAIFSWSILFVVYGLMQPQASRKYFGDFLLVGEIALWLLLVFSVVVTSMIVYFHIKREKNSIPKALFFINSVLMYTPYLYAAVILVDIYQMEIATLTSLMTHYMQYMGLVWLINVNKYQGQRYMPRKISSLTN